MQLTTEQILVDLLPVLFGDEPWSYQRVAINTRKLASVRERALKALA